MFKKYITRKKENIKNMTQPTLDHWSDLDTDLKSRIKNLTRNRSAAESDLVQENFQVLLNAWGMRMSDISHVIFSMKIRCFLFLLPIFFSVLLFLQSHYFLSILLCLVGVVGILISVWRISILRNKQFIPSLKWILHKFWQKKTIH